MYSSIINLLLNIKNTVNNITTDNFLFFYNKELFKKLDIQLHYLLLSKDESINFFIECFNIEKDKFIQLEKENIQLFKSHYDYLKKLLEDLYDKPLKLKRNPKIDIELYNLLNSILVYN